MTGYDVLRNGSVVGTPTGTTFTDTGLASGTTFTYTVRARDAAGNLGPASNAVTATTLPAGPGDNITIVVAGDIASLTNGEHYETARLIEQIQPNHILTVGDNQYDNGTLTEFRNHYDKSWGKWKSITHPATGNHEWYDNLNGYKAYFGTQAFPNGKPYYSWEAGEFHFVSVDSDPMDNDGSDSTQVNWLKADLARCGAYPRGAQSPASRRWIDRAARAPVATAAAMQGWAGSATSPAAKSPRHEVSMPASTRR